MVRKILAGTVAIAWSLSGQTQRPIDFQREIRPILSDNCFQCHGPDSTTRMAGLRLDQKETTLEVRPRGAAVVAGKPDASLLYQRVASPTAARRMPPEYSHKSLNPAQIALLKKWIEQGAPWQEHWAFRAPTVPAVPAVRNTAWAKNAIDHFVLAKLEAEGLQPAPAADARTLIRRVSLDLTGLPPKPAEIEVFLKDTSPAAYEHMVDRYLASPHYGEHRARYWLDAARYADTNGIHFDNYRAIWPYRDWVIDAFNRNLSFDRFSTEQLAGDLLPNATLDQLIATGFYRCGTTTNEAGIIEDEYAEIYAKDRVDTTGAIWLGMTVGCATCHDHKFDPISQKDFYSLGAFFRNTTQKVMDGNVHDTPPVIVVPRADERADWLKLQARLHAIPGELQRVADASTAEFKSWLAKGEKLDLQQPLGDQSQTYRADLKMLSAGVDILEFPNPQGINLPDVPKFETEKPFTISVSYQVAADKNYVIAAQQNAKEKNRGWALDIAGGLIGFKLTGDDGKTIEARAVRKLPFQAGAWTRVVVTYDGERKHSGMYLYVNGEQVEVQGIGNQPAELPGSITAESPVVLGKSLEKGAIADFRVFNRVATVSEASLLSQWTGVEAGDEAALRTYWLVRENAPYRKLAAEQQALNLEEAAMAGRGTITMVMEERTDSKPFANILYRGAYDQKREKVDANTPSILPPMAGDLPHNRLGFARWLFTKEHPLTARVTVNRMWQEVLGAGLVRTLDDFGSQGETPSHAELLDWLATDFRDHGWDVKRFYKQLVMSATYRQTAQTTPEKQAKDPENRLLSSAPRFRMDAEMVRDYALAASGLLSPGIGGASVKPYQPDGVWEAVAMDGSNTRFGKRDGGDGLYRRSMYTFWKRSAPPASMDIFNAPTREACTVRRERTDTPLQALATMNDVQFVEAARALAGRSMESLASFDEQLDFVALRLLARPLTAAERQIATKSYAEFERFYDGHPADARKLLATGERKADPALATAEFAAMTMLTSELMNLDEAEQRNERAEAGRSRALLTGSARTGSRVARTAGGGTASSGWNRARDGDGGDASPLLRARSAGHWRAGAGESAGRARGRRGNCRSRGAAALSTQGEALHLPASDGRPAADGDLRLQAGHEGVVRQGSARIDPAGPAPDHHDERADALPHRTLRIPVRAARQERRVGFGTAALYRAHGGRYRDHPQHAHGGDQSRTGDYVFSNRLHGRGTAVHRKLVELRPRQHESGSARVRGATGEALSSQGQCAGDFVAPVERGIPLGPVFRREPAQRRGPGALHQQPRWRGPGGPAQHAERAERDE